MDEETSQTNHSLGNILKKSDSFLDPTEEATKEATTLSIDLILSKDLVERILAYLPIATIFIATCVSKRWNEIINSKNFRRNFSRNPSLKPWYFTSTKTDGPLNAYDPILGKWFKIQLPFIDPHNWQYTSSNGLICFMDSRSMLCVCNPITRHHKVLLEPPGLKFSDYKAFAISTNRISNSYNVTIVQSSETGNDFQPRISIHIYDSETMMWQTCFTEVLMGSRGSRQSVICDGVLYFLIYTVGAVDYPEHHYGLISYNLSSRSSSSNGLSVKGFITVPCALTFVRLMNMKEKLVLVGRIGKQDRPYSTIKGIGIWILNNGKEEWEEIGRMPHEFLQVFEKVDYDLDFDSYGMDEVIYIHSWGATGLVTFDVNLKQWKWVKKMYPFELCPAFCVEPRLDISP